MGAQVWIWAHSSKTQPWWAHTVVDHGWTWWSWRSFPNRRILWPSGSFHISSSGAELLQSSHKNFRQGTLCGLWTPECWATFTIGILVFFLIFVSCSTASGVIILLRWSEYAVWAVKAPAENSLSTTCFVLDTQMSEVFKIRSFGV